MSGIPEIHDLYGTPYEIGCQSGSLFHGTVKIRMDDITAFMKNCPEETEHALSEFEKMKYDYPVYYEETIGKADGLGVDRNAYIMMMHPEILQRHSDACTTIMNVRSDGSIVLAHNEDDIWQENNFALVRVHTEDGWFITNDMYNMPFGNGICINSHRIVRCINYCHDHAGEGYSRYFVQRHLAMVKDIDDLKRRTMEMKPASGFHVNLIDEKVSQAYSIEVMKDRTSIHNVRHTAVHANHFVHELHKKQWYYDTSGNSVFRYETAKDEIEKTVHPELDDMQEILNMHTDTWQTSILQCHDIPNRTIFRFACDTNSHTYEIHDFMHGKTCMMGEELWQTTEK